MKKTFFLFAALVAVAACKQVEISVPETEETFREVSIVASAIDTKTQLQGDNTVRWEETDEIKLMFSPAVGSDVAVRTSEFTFTETEDNGATAKFTGKIANTVTTDGGYSDDVFAVYPSTAMDESGAVTWAIDAEQAVAPGSFPTNANLSSAKISLNELNANEVANTSFKNALSIIRFTLPNEYVKTVSVTGTSAFTGERTMAFDEYGYLKMKNADVADAEKTITMTPAEGDAFKSGAENVYNILVYPGTHSSLTVNLTDEHGCTLSNTIEREFVFDAAKFYTFNFNSEFTKTYSFTSTLVPTGENKVLAVFEDYTQELNYTDSKFTGYLKASMVHADTPEVGYAVYPSTAYDGGVINYNISDPLAEPSVLMAASLPVATLKNSTPSITFTSVETALAKLEFTVPAGVKSVKIVSTEDVVGPATLSFDKNSNSLSVATRNGGKTIDLDDLDPQDYSLNIYPVSGATLTVTLTDGMGATVEKIFEDVTVNAGASHELVLSGELNFDKNGSFGNEGFVDGIGGGNSIDF